MCDRKKQKQKENKEIKSYRAVYTYSISLKKYAVAKYSNFC